VKVNAKGDFNPNPIPNHKSIGLFHIKNSATSINMKEPQTRDS